MTYSGWLFRERTILNSFFQAIDFIKYGKNNVALNEPEKDATLLIVLFLHFVCLCVLVYACMLAHTLKVEKEMRTIFIVW